MVQYKKDLSQNQLIEHFMNNGCAGQFFISIKGLSNLVHLFRVIQQSMTSKINYVTVPNISNSGLTMSQKISYVTS